LWCGGLVADRISCVSISRDMHACKADQPDLERWLRVSTGGQVVGRPFVHQKMMRT
jgi:hypothetical protein